MIWKVLLFFWWWQNWKLQRTEKLDKSPRVSVGNFQLGMSLYFSDQLWRRFVVGISRTQFCSPFFCRSDFLYEVQPRTCLVVFRKSFLWKLLVVSLLLAEVNFGSGSNSGLCICLFPTDPSLFQTLLLPLWNFLIAAFCISANSAKFPLERSQKFACCHSGKKWRKFGTREAARAAWEILLITKPLRVYFRCIVRRSRELLVRLSEQIRPRVKKIGFKCFCTCFDFDVHGEDVKKLKYLLTFDYQYYYDKLWRFSICSYRLFLSYMKLRYLNNNAGSIHLCSHIQRGTFNETWPNSLLRLWCIIFCHSGDMMNC